MSTFFNELIKLCEEDSIVSMTIFLSKYKSLQAKYVNETIVEAMDLHTCVKFFPLIENVEDHVSCFIHVHEAVRLQQSFPQSSIWILLPESSKETDVVMSLQQLHQIKERARKETSLKEEDRVRLVPKLWLMHALSMLHINIKTRNNVIIRFSEEVDNVKQSVTIEQLWMYAKYVYNFFAILLMQIIKQKSEVIRTRSDGMADLSRYDSFLTISTTSNN